MYIYIGFPLTTIWFRFRPRHRRRHVILHQFPKFYRNRTTIGRKKMTSCRFSGWRISAILDFRGPVMGTLKSPCTTWLSIETGALNCLVFWENLVFCILGTDRQTNRWTAPMHEAALADASGGLIKNARFLSTFEAWLWISTSVERRRTRPVDLADRIQLRHGFTLTRDAASITSALTSCVPVVETRSRGDIDWRGVLGYCVSVCAANVRQILGSALHVLVVTVLDSMWCVYHIVVIGFKITGFLYYEHLYLPDIW